MRKSMTLILLAILCMTFTGCKDLSKSESLQPNIDIKYVGNDTTDSASIPEKQDDTDSADNFDHSDAKQKENESATVSTDSVYELYSFGNDDVTYIPGKEYDSGETNIHGTVLGIGKYTVIINKAFTAEYTPDGEYIDENTMVSFEDTDEQFREYVQFTEESTFTLRETKNSGAEGKDSPAAFETIKTGDLLDIRGYYVDGLFTAINTVIYRNLDI